MLRKRAFLDLFGKIPVGGGDETDVGGEGFIGAEAGDGGIGTGDIEGGQVIGDGDERIRQEIAGEVKVMLEVADLASIPPSDREKEAARQAAAEAMRAFDLTRGPLIRARS